ncbi:parvin [Carabus blaptoides fortunei]
MDDDIVEKPVQRLLFRQSSLETRLSPVHLSEDSGSDTEDVSKPKIVDVVRKSSRSSETIPDADEQKKVNCNDEEKRKMPQNEISVATIKGLTFNRTNNTMASPRPKSPRTVGGNKNEESIWDKIGTLGRKKRIKEVQEVQIEGKNAIDSPGNPANLDYPPEDYALEDNEERSMIEPKSFEDRKLLELIQVLIEWINDELAEQRIIVKNLEEDLYDGQVLQKLLEKLTGDKLDVPEVTQSEEGQRQKLSIVLAHVNRILGLQRYPNNKWSVESVHSKNIVAILHLLVSLARHFRAPIRLPENVSVTVVVVRKSSGQLDHRIIKEEITSVYDDVGMRCERDAFDTLFDHAPEKLQVVKKSLVTFVNKHLSKVNLEVTELDTQFHDGVYLTLLMGLLEGFFVPLYSFYLTPQDFDQKVHNVAFAFELMEDVGLPKPKARPEDIVNLDLKSTLRVLYNLFTKYKSIM